MASAALETAAAGPDAAAPATIQAAKQLAKVFVEAALQATADELGLTDAHIGSPGNGPPQTARPANDGGRRTTEDGEGPAPKRRKLASQAPPDEDEQKAVRSAYFGVSWQNRSRKWKARIQHEGRTYHLGLFAEERLAARAFDSAARRLRRELSGAKLNFPTPAEKEAAKAASDLEALGEAIASTRVAQGLPSSPFFGVSWKRRDRRWAAQIEHAGKKVVLGSFLDQVAAALAFDAAARRLRGDQAQGGRVGRGGTIWRLNFPSGSPLAAQLILSASV